MNIEIMRNKKIDIPLILKQLKFCDCKIHKPNVNLITSAKKAKLLLSRSDVYAKILINIKMA